MQQKQTVLVSYSGGKDSSLALYHMLQTTEVVGLIAMLEEQGQRSRSHGMDTAFITAQAQALGLPIISAAASWQDYEAEFAKLLKQCQQQGVSVLASGQLARANGAGSRFAIANAAVATSAPSGGG